MSLASFALGLTALASTAGPPPQTRPEGEQHPLVTAGEALYERKFTEPCDEVIKLALTAPGLADGDRIRLHFLAAMRAIDARDDAAANQAVEMALQVNPLAEPPPYASPRLLRLIKKARPKNPPKRPERVVGSDGPAAAQEPSSKILLEVVNKLYLKAQVEGATIVLELARSSAALDVSDRVQVALWRGVLKMEMGEESSARVAFRDALLVDRNAELPSSLPYKTRHLFDEVKLSLPVADPSAKVTVTPTTMVSVSGLPPDTKLYLGGAGLALVAGGIAAGSVALAAHQDMRRASVDGDWAIYTRSRETGKIALNVADGLFGLGAVVLGVGALVLWNEHSAFQVGANTGKGQASVVVGGRF